MESTRAHPRANGATERILTRKMTAASCTAGGGTLPVALTVGERIEGNGLSLYSGDTTSYTYEVNSGPSVLTLL
jgi:hypothetical protein